MVQYLISMGVTPTAMAGHSLGELVALSIAGVFSYDDGFRIVNKRAQCMDRAGGLEGDPGTMIAVDAPMAYLQDKVAGCDNVYFTNYNGPHQVVLGGRTGAVLDLMNAIKQDDYRATRLNVGMAFHSPVMKVIRGEMAAFVSGIRFHSPEIPVISNTTMEPYPEDPDRIREILTAHLESPVHWMQNIRTLRDHFGIRHFVEIGPKDTLCNLVSETLAQALCIRTCMPGAESHTYRAGLAHLYALGHLAPDRVAPLEMAAPESAPNAAPRGTSRAPADDRVAAIVQREINAFILESFGKIIKPKIVETVRRELDPGFTGEHLDQILEGPPAPQPMRSPRPKPAPVPPAGRTPDSAPPSPEPVPSGGRNAAGDTLEQVIQIIMDATGYERDEIEPDMDIRQDLAIRSSRLPVIMGDVERQFEITVSVEDFIGLRTVKEIAETIAKLAGRPGSMPPARESAEKMPSAASPVTTDDPQRSTTADRSDGDIRRLVFEETELPPAPLEPLRLDPGQQVAVLTMNPGSSLVADLYGGLENKFKARPITLDCAGNSNGGRFDLRTPEGARRAAEELVNAESLAGLILVLEAGTESVLSGTEEIPAFLTGFFVCLQKLLNSKNKAFCLCLLRGIQAHTPEAHTAEGILGMFLAADQEYASVLFRRVDMDTRTNFHYALDRALDTGNPLVQLICRDRATFSIKATHEPLPLPGGRELQLKAGDVVVISGGAKGVSYRLARALAAFKPRLVLLGRTGLEPAAVEDNGAENASRDPAGLDSARNVARLSALGIEATYHRCDVGNFRDVSRTLEKVVEQYGRIDGIIHGAGLIEDAFIGFMTPENFKKVVDVKLLGAWNLYRASKDHGLRFMAALSSLVAIQGNVGQVNYCAANRSLSALLKSLAASHGGLFAKAFMLPPIEGTGMAEDPEIKELMKRKGLENAFVHADAFAQLFCRELFLGSARDAWLAWTRTFPEVKGTLVAPTDSSGQDSRHCSGGVHFRSNDFPLIENVTELDLQSGELSAGRHFSRDRDLWLADHKPFKILRHPLVSRIMAVETILEAAQLLYPHLCVQGVRRLKFEDILECPPDMEREARITCKRNHDPGCRILCDVRLDSVDISPTGRRLDRWSTNCRGRVILGSQTAPLPPWPESDLNSDDLDTGAMDLQEIQQSYEQRTGLTGRYRVLGKIYGTRRGAIKGEMIYGDQADIKDLNNVRYHYPPYLMEALMHLFAFYPALRDNDNTWRLIPAGLDEMRFTRTARKGERFELEARLRSQDDRGYTWDARAVDDNGTAVMQIRAMRMNRYNP